MRVPIKRRLIVARKHALLAPGAKQVCGMRVLYISLPLGQDQVHDVVRMCCGELRAVLRVDDVVRGRHHRTHALAAAAAETRKVVTKWRKRSDLSRTRS